MICWKCKKNISIESIYRTTECPECHADLHCCKGCKYYSTLSHFECRETVSEPVSDKEKANFCEFFAVNKNISAGENAGGSAKSASDAARDAFNALFN